MVEAVCEVINQKGMHARAAARIVAEVVKFTSDATLTHKDRVAPGDSLIKLLTLNAPKGSQIKISSVGPDSEQLLSALKNLFAQGFGE
ncbi:HPr family phosphocarrier protein [Aliikangiella sp. IMCC44359]|uniref:HPr family phosphocarrier protein n=1 Tax=Aliikangiella sp. IMCC44359 TaxID=3459125 RepID=UPI00403B1CE0